MARFHKLRIYHLAMDVLTSTHAVLPQFRGYGELRDQMKRSSLSVVSTFARWSVGMPVTRHFLGIARASNAEPRANGSSRSGWCQPNRLQESLTNWITWGEC